MSRSARLLDEPPVPVQPSVAKALGLNEAIVIQQLHWTLGRDSALVEGDMRWVQISMERWMGYFPWWSESTIRRAFRALEDEGLVSTKRGRESNVYAIHYDRLAVKLTDASVTLTDGIGQSDRHIVERGSERKTERTEGVGQADLALPGMEPVPAPAPLDSSPSEDPGVDEVWDHYLAVFGDRLRIKDLTPARRRMLKKGLNAISNNVSVAKAAVNGLQSYRTGHPEGSQDVSLSVIFETGPHSRSNLTDQIEWWASQAADQQTVDPSVPSVLRDRIVRRRVLVAEMLGRPDDEAARERGQEALEWLRAHAKEEPVITSEGKIGGWIKVTP